MEFYFLNSVQLSCDFGKMVPSGTTQGKVCHIDSSKRLGNCHNYGELGHWARDCKQNYGGDGKEKMKNKLKDKSSHFANILVNDKQDSPKE